MSLIYQRETKNSKRVRSVNYSTLLYCCCIKIENWVDVVAGGAFVFVLLYFQEGCRVCTPVYVAVDSVSVA